MSLINLGLITLLFSFWIWTLKQENENLRRLEERHATVGDAPEAPHSHVVAPHTHHHDVQPVQQQHTPPSPKHRNALGVPTWTIDAVR